MKTVLFAMVMFLMAVPAMAGELIEVKVTGLTEAKEDAIRADLKKRPELDIVEVDADTGYVEVSCKKGYDITNMVVSELLEKEGLKVVSVKRTGN